MSDDESDPRKVLMAQARQLKMKTDARWSTDTLAEKVAAALEDATEEEDKAVKDAADTWVFCIRDCFLGTEKHPAGSVIKAPKPLYANWKVTGAARLADDDEIPGR